MKYEDRHLYIGGSDFGCVLDINPYKRRIDLVLEKAQVIKSTFGGNDATRRGEMLEDSVIKLFEEQTGQTIIDKQKEFSHNATDCCMKLLCHVDGMTEDNKAVFEAKTTDANGKVWCDGIPSYYKAQLEFNMYLSGVNKAYIAVAYCEDLEIIKFEYFEYERQMSDDEILQHCVLFTKDVAKYSTLGCLNTGKVRDDEIDGDQIERYQQLIELIKKQKAALTPLENEKKKIEESLKAQIGSDAAIQDSCYIVSLGNRITSPSYDYKVCRTGITIKYKGEQ